MTLFAVRYLITAVMFEAAVFTSYTLVPSTFTIDHVEVQSNLTLCGTIKPTHKTITVRLRGIKFASSGVYKAQTQRIIQYIVNRSPVTFSRALVSRGGVVAGIATASSFVSGHSLMFWFPTLQELLVSGGFARITDRKNVPDAVLSAEQEARHSGWLFWQPSESEGQHKSMVKDLPLAFVRNDYDAFGVKSWNPKKSYYPTVGTVGQLLQVYGEKSSVGESEDNSPVGPFILFGVRLSSNASMAEWGYLLCEMILMSRPFSCYKIKASGEYVVTFPGIVLSNGLTVDCLNKVLLREGAAKCIGNVPKSYRALEETAKQEGLGMWAPKI